MFYPRKSRPKDTDGFFSLERLSFPFRKDINPYKPLTQQFTQATRKPIAPDIPRPNDEVSDETNLVVSYVRYSLIHSDEGLTLETSVFESSTVATTIYLSDLVVDNLL